MLPKGAFIYDIQSEGEGGQQIPKMCRQTVQVLQTETGRGDQKIKKYVDVKYGSPLTQSDLFVCLSLLFPCPSSSPVVVAVRCVPSAFWPTFAFVKSAALRPFMLLVSGIIVVSLNRFCHFPPTLRFSTDSTRERTLLCFRFGTLHKLLTDQC